MTARAVASSSLEVASSCRAISTNRAATAPHEGAPSLPPPRQATAPTRTASTAARTIPAVFGPTGPRVKQRAASSTPPTGLAFDVVDPGTTTIRPRGRRTAHRDWLGTSRADTAPQSFQPSRSNHPAGRRTTSGSYAARIGHMKSLCSSSFQSGNEMPLENGSTSHVLASPYRSSRCFLQLFRHVRQHMARPRRDVITSLDHSREVRQ